MKVSIILSEARQEFIPHNDKAERASMLGHQILQKAQEEAYRQGRPNDVKFVKDLADKMVNRFASNVLASIDEELKFSQMQQVGK